MDARSGSVPFWIGTLAGVFLGSVLLFASWAKMIDPAAFVELIELEGLDFLLPGWIVAPIGLALEAGLGMALLLNVRRWWILLPTATLVLFFLYLTGRAYAAYLEGGKDPAHSCGCFGNLVERTPSEAFWGDLLLMLPALCLVFVGRPKAGGFPRLRMEVVGAAVLMALAFAWKAPELPLDDLATRLSEGVAVDTLCVGEGEQRVCVDHLAPELGEGRHLLMIADLSDRSFRYAVPRLSDLALSEAGLGLVVLTAAEVDEITQFSWELGPSFDIRHAPAQLLRPLYRRTPRSALVEDGRVLRTYDGFPSSEEFMPKPMDVPDGN